MGTAHGRTCSLFVEEIYAYRAADLVAARAYWLGELALGEQAARKAMAANPDEARVARNLQFYEDRR